MIAHWVPIVLIPSELVQSAWSHWETQKIESVVRPPLFLGDANERITVNLIVLLGYREVSGHGVMLSWREARDGFIE